MADFDFIVVQKEKGVTSVTARRVKKTLDKPPAAKKPKTAKKRSAKVAKKAPQKKTFVKKTKKKVAQKKTRVKKSSAKKVATRKKATKKATRKRVTPRKRSVKPRKNIKAKKVSSKGKKTKKMAHPKPISHHVDAGYSVQVPSQGYAFVHCDHTNCAECVRCGMIQFGIGLLTGLFMALIIARVAYA